VKKKECWVETVLWIGCLLDFEMWVLHSKVEADKHERAGAEFKGLRTAHHQREVFCFHQKVQL